MAEAQEAEGIEVDLLPEPVRPHGVHRRLAKLFPGAAVKEAPPAVLRLLRSMMRASYSVEDHADESLLPPLKEPMEWWTTDERVDEDSSPIDNPNCEEQIELNSAVEIVIHGASFHIIGSAPSRVMNTHSSADKGTTLWLMSLGQRRISIAV